jgi:hypothetical protein
MPGGQQLLPTTHHRLTNKQGLAFDRLRASWFFVAPSPSIDGIRPQGGRQAAWQTSK